MNSNAQMKGTDEENDKSKLEKFEDEVKNIVFGILFVMLKDKEYSFWKFVILLIITELQMFASFFPPQISFPWNAGVVETAFYQVVHFFEINRWVFTLSFELYLVIFYICIFLVFVLVVDIVYVSLSFTRKKFIFIWPLSLLKFISSLIVTILFMPFIGLLTKDCF